MRPPISPRTYTLVACMTLCRAGCRFGQRDVEGGGVARRFDLADRRAIQDRDLRQRRRRRRAVVQADLEETSVAHLVVAVVNDPQAGPRPVAGRRQGERSEEHTSELQSLMRISYAVFCLKKKKNITRQT